MFQLGTSLSPPPAPRAQGGRGHHPSSHHGGHSLPSPPSVARLERELRDVRERAEQVQRALAAYDQGNPLLVRTRADAQQRGQQGFGRGEGSSVRGGAAAPPPPPAAPITPQQATAWLLEYLQSHQQQQQGEQAESAAAGAGPAPSLLAHLPPGVEHRDVASWFEQYLLQDPR